MAAALSRATGVYTFDEHLDGKNDDIRELTAMIREFILGLDESIEEVPKKYYVAYKISQNIVCMEIKGRNIKLFLKLKPSDIPADTGHYRDVTSIGHYGTGDVEFTLASEADFEQEKITVRAMWNSLLLQRRTLSQ